MKTKTLLAAVCTIGLLAAPSAFATGGGKVKPPVAQTNGGPGVKKPPAATQTGGSKQKPPVAESAQSRWYQILMDMM